MGISPEGPFGNALIDPVIEYFNRKHPDIVPGDPNDPNDRGTPNGRAVVGGFVYRGENVPELEGKYVFGDGSRDFGSPNGSLFVAEEVSDGVFLMSEVLIEEDGGVQTLSRFLLGFGEDESGELYLLTNLTGNPFPDDSGVGTGVILEIVPEPSTMLLLVCAVGGVLASRRRGRVRDP